MRLSESLLFHHVYHPFTLLFLAVYSCSRQIIFAALQCIQTHPRVIIFVNFSSYRAFYDLPVVTYAAPIICNWQFRFAASKRHTLHPCDVPDSLRFLL